MRIEWGQHGRLSSQTYICGYCGRDVASELGYSASGVDDYGRNISAFLYICHHCHRPTLFDWEGQQTPGPMYGATVDDIDDSAVAALYDEARNCTAAGAYTAAVLACRKLLMHVAVSKGAKQNESFISYVEYLASSGLIPPDAKGWVDHIREKGNEANHEIVIMGEEDAKDLVSFSEMLLRIIFEFPARIKKKTAK